MNILIDYYLVGLGLSTIGLTLYNTLDKLNSSTKETEYTLKIGYSGTFIKKPIVADMRLYPHLLCCGLSNSGKSKCIEYAIKNKQCVLLNAFSDDFISIKCRRIIGNKKILTYLKSLLDNPYKRERPLYIVIDEMLSLCIDKNITKAIMELLAVGRHYNIILIGISQRATATEIPFKNLFNCRMTFRQIESSSYSTILGYSVEDKHLNNREFIIATDKLLRGKTYDL